MNSTPTEDAPTFVPLAGAPISIGRTGEVTLRLLHPSVSRRHATLRPAGGGLVVEDHDSRFGTYINGVRVRTAAARPGDLLRFGSVTAYRVEPGGLRLDVAAGGLEVTAVGLTIAAPRPPGIPELMARARRSFAAADRAEPAAGRRITLIRDVGFGIRRDALVGILGPSGAGKSTVLHCLASYLPPGGGRLLFDGDATPSPSRTPTGR